MFWDLLKCFFYLVFNVLVVLVRFLDILGHFMTCCDILGHFGRFCNVFGRFWMFLEFPTFLLS